MIAECCNYTDYHSRAVEVRCGHGKGHGPGGNTKRYVHLVRCVISFNMLAEVWTSDVQASGNQAAPSIVDFVKLKPMKMSANEPKQHSSDSAKTQRRHGNKQAGSSSSSSSSSSTTTTTTSTTSTPASRPRTRTHFNKLCTQEGIQQLADIFTHQSFLCGAGWIATNEDAIVFSRLHSFMYHIVQLEVGRLDDVLKQHAKQQQNSGPVKSGAHSSLYRLKQELHSQGVCCLESSLMAACRELDTFQIQHRLTDVAQWFVNKRSFWRWFRCLYVMEEKTRCMWLPTVEHLKSGRVSMLFDL